MGCSSSEVIGSREVVQHVLLNVIIHPGMVRCWCTDRRFNVMGLRALLAGHSDPVLLIPASATGR